MAAASYDAQIRQNEQRALADYILNPTRQILGNIPAIASQELAQLQGQRNADRSFGFEQTQADRSYGLQQGAARERAASRGIQQRQFRSSTWQRKHASDLARAEAKREFGVSEATRRQGIKANADIARQAYGLKVADTTGYLPDGTPTAATRKAEADRQTRVKLAKLGNETRVALAKVTAGLARDRMVQSATAAQQRAEQARGKEGRAAWSSALGKAYNVIDTAVKPTSGSAGSKGSSKVTVVYTPAPASITNTGGVQVPDPTAHPPQPKTKNFPDMATYAAWRKQFYKQNPGGKIASAKQITSGATPGAKGKTASYGATINQALAILRQQNQAYGLGLSDAQMRKAVTDYGVHAFGSRGLLPKKKS